MLLQADIHAKHPTNVEFQKGPLESCTMGVKWIFFVGDLFSGLCEDTLSEGMESWTMGGEPPALWMRGAPRRPRNSEKAP
jgi:hypothetical protein